MKNLRMMTVPLGNILSLIVGFLLGCMIVNSIAAYVLNSENDKSSVNYETFSIGYNTDEIDIDDYTTNINDTVKIELDENEEVLPTEYIIKYTPNIEGKSMLIGEIDLNLII
jgi:hypothetical protein